MITRLRTFRCVMDGLIHNAVVLSTSMGDGESWPRYACDTSVTVGVQSLNDKRSENMIPTCLQCAGGVQWWRTTTPY